MLQLVLAPLFQGEEDGGLLQPTAPLGVVGEGAQLAVGGGEGEGVAVGVVAVAAGSEAVAAVHLLHLSQ